jgi:histidine triad (HIT) family protein
LGNSGVIAFWHPKPSWEKHIVIVPKRSIKSLCDISKKDYEYIAEAVAIAGEIAKKFRWKKKRYSLIVHGGKGQKVNQLHFHLNCGKYIDS